MDRMGLSKLPLIPTIIIQAFNLIMLGQLWTISIHQTKANLATLVFMIITLPAPMLKQAITIQWTNKMGPSL